MGTPMLLDIRDDNDVLPMYTAMDGTERFLNEKMNGLEIIRDFRDSLEQYVKGKERNVQIDFIKNWIGSIDNYLSSPNTIGKMATQIMFGDFKHFSPDFYEKDIFANKYTEIANDYNIKKIGDSFKVIYDQNILKEKIVEYKMAGENITMGELIEKESLNPNIFINPEYTHSFKIDEKPLNEKDILIKVKMKNDNDTLEHKAYSSTYIKMKNGSREKLLEILTVLPYNFAYFFDVGTFGLNKKLSILKPAKKINLDGTVKDVENKENGKILNNNSINCFSIFNMVSLKDLDSFSEDKVNHGENLERIDSSLPLNIFPEKMIKLLVFFYPDMFEPLTAGEVKYVVNHNLKEDVRYEIEGERITESTISFTQPVTKAEFDNAEKKFLEVKGFIEANLSQKFKNFTQKRKNVDINSKVSFDEKSGSFYYSSELALYSVMHAYDLFLLERYKEGLNLNEKNNNARKIKP